MPPRLTCYSEVNKMAVKKTLTFKIEVSISGFDEYPVDQTRELFELRNALDNSIELSDYKYLIGISKYVEEYD